ncbi:unnamed protein product, partial [Staurois parvus]
MHFPKKKKLSSNTHHIEHVQLAPQGCVLSGDESGTVEQGGSEKTGSNILFYTMQRINPVSYSEYNKHALLHIQTDFTVVGL